MNINNNHDNNIHLPTKQCRVCGFNFNAITCESCKSFFRRNALKLDKLQCVVGNRQCRINVHSRMFCKRCRLEKCFSVGMVKVNKKRRKREGEVEKIKQNSIEIHVHKPNKQNHDHSLDAQMLLSLREIQNAMTSSYGAGSRYEVILGEVTDILQVLNLSAYDISKTIHFCKGLAAFNSLKSDDQLILLKWFYPAKYCVKVSYLYSADSEGWIELSGEIGKQGYLVRMQVFQQCNQQNFHTLFQKFIRSLHFEMENDTVIRDLVLAQQLFKPSQSYSISVPEYARFYHIQYRYLLRRYLEHKYQSQVQAKRKYISLIELIGQLDYVAEAVRNVYAKIKPDQLCELLVEMFLH